MNGQHRKYVSESTQWELIRPFHDTHEQQGTGEGQGGGGSPHR